MKNIHLISAFFEKKTKNTRLSKMWSAGSVRGSAVAAGSAAYSEADAEWFVKDCMEKEGKTQFSRAIVIDGEAVGSISLLFGDDVYSRSAELGYWLGEPFWRKGIMTEAVQKMCEEAFRRYKLIRISAEPFSTNLASRGVLEKAGFTLEGIKRKSIFKNGCIQDSYLYAVIHV